MASVDTPERGFDARGPGGSRSGSRSLKSETVRLGLAYGLALLVLLAPVLLVDHPRMVDLPNHLARHFIAGALEATPALRTFYDFSWALLPNLAVDFLYIPFSWFLTPYDAARAIVGLIVLLWFAAPIVLHRVIWGRFGYWPLFASLVIYNANLVWGFENYLLTSALSVLVFALWIVSRDRVDAWRLAVFVLLASAIYLGHLIAFGLLGILIVSYELGRIRRHREPGLPGAWRNLGVAGLGFLPGVLHLVWVVATGVSEQGSVTVFGLSKRANALISPALQTFGPNDLLVFLVIVAILAFALSKPDLLRVHRDLKPVLLVLAGLSFLAPHKLMGIAFVEYRLPFVFIVLLVASSRWNATGARFVGLVPAAIAATLALRMFAVTEAWRDHNAEVVELIGAFRQIEETPRILAVRDDAAPLDRLHYHSAAFAVIERNAYVPTLFTGVQLLAARPPFRRLDRPHGRPVPLSRLIAARWAKAPGGGDFAELWRSWWLDYSHVLLLNRQEVENPFPGILEAMVKGRAFTLYRNLRFQAEDQIRLLPSGEASPADSEGTRLIQ